MMRRLEQAGLLDRVVETLPDDAALEEMEKAGLSLTRPEIGVLLAYAKLTLYDALLSSRVPDDDYLALELFRYFPEAMREPYRSEIASHRLRREIIATMLANSLINRGGPTFVTRISDQTGADVYQIAEAFTAVRDAYGLTALNGEIDALDTHVEGELQLELYTAVQDLVLDQTVWFLRDVSFADGIEAVVTRFRTGIEELSPKLVDILPETMREEIAVETGRLIAGGVPNALAARIAMLPVEATIPDIVLVAERSGKPLTDVAKTFFDVAGHFRLGAMDTKARGLDLRDYYDGLALDRARATLADAHRRITGEALALDGFAGWLAANEAKVGRTTRAANEIVDGELTVSKFSVAASLLAELAR